MDEPLGTTIAARRKELGLTIDDLVKAARLAGGKLSRSYLSRVERGERAVTEGQARVLGRVLGLRLIWVPVAYEPRTS